MDVPGLVAYKLVAYKTKKRVSWEMNTYKFRGLLIFANSCLGRLTGLPAEMLSSNTEYTVAYKEVAYKKYRVLLGKTKYVKLRIVRQGISVAITNKKSA